MVNKIGSPAGPHPANLPGITIDGEQWFHCSGGAIKSPRAISTPNPEYTEVARQLKFQGRNAFIVLISKSGVVDRVFVRRPLGLGLDESSINAFKIWKFTPGAMD